MADEKETIIFDIKVDEGPGAATVDKLTVSIGALTEANKKLRAERKDLDLQSEAGIKRTKEINDQLDKNTKTIKDNSSALEKQRLNIGNYTGALDKLLPGLGATANGMKALINPVTAVAAGLGLLTAAYIKSAAGAEDAARAGNNFKAFLDTFNNQVGNAGGGGILSGISGFFTDQLAFLTGTDKLSIQRAQVALNDLRQLEVQILKNAEIQKRTQREAEEARRIRDDSTRSYEERLQAIQTINDKLSESETDRVGNIDKGIKLLLEYGVITGSISEFVLEEFETTRKLNLEGVTGLELQKQLQTLMNQRSDVLEEMSGKITENLKSEQAITLENQKQLSTAREKNAELTEEVRLQRELDASRATEKEINENLAANQADRLATVKDGLEAEVKLTTTFAQGVANVWKTTNASILKDKEITDSLLFQSQFELVIGLSNLLGALGRNNKAFASGQALVNTWLGVTEILSAKSLLPSPFDWITKALNTGAVLASGFNAIRNINRAAGGGNFLTKGPTMLLVGDNPGGVERVTVEPLSGRGKTKASGNLIQMAGGGTLTTSPAPFQTQQIAQQVAGERMLRDLGASFERLRIAVVIEDVNKLQAQQAEILEQATI